MKPLDLFYMFGVVHGLILGTVYTLAGDHGSAAIVFLMSSGMSFCWMYLKGRKA